MRSKKIKKVFICLRKDGRRSAEIEQLRGLLKENSSKYGVAITEDIKDVKGSDLVIAGGGDGTYLDAAHIAYSLDVPVAGINIGHLGFLVEIHMDDLDVIESLFSGDFNVGKRLILDVSVKRGGRKVFSQIALNEAAIQRNLDTPMLCFGIKYNDEELPKYRGDGVLIATPTGSTAYNLSFNGPILYPSGNSLVINAMAPHALTHRPIVIPADGTVLVEIKECGRGVLNCDGRTSCEIFENDRIIIKKSAKSLQYISNRSRTFFEILSQKLHLGKRM